MNVEETIQTISGHLLLNNEIEGTDLLKEMGEEGIKPSLVAQAILKMKKAGAIKLEGEGLSLTKNRVIFVKEYEAPAPVVQEVKTPSPSVSSTSKGGKFGTTTMMRKDGSTYEYFRSAWDGPEAQLDELHEQMRGAFIQFSQDLRDEIEEFCGAGGTAITMKEPENKFSNKEGKVFYRWDNPEKTQPLMDKLWPTVKAMIEKYSSIEVGGDE